MMAVESRRNVLTIGQVASGRSPFVRYKGCIMRATTHATTHATTRTLQHALQHTRYNRVNMNTLRGPAPLTTKMFSLISAMTLTVPTGFSPALSGGTVINLVREGFKKLLEVG